MTFSQFMEFFTTHFKWMLERCDCLFDTSADPDTLWSLYLDSFPAEVNTFFRKRREFDCSCCRHFIRRFGSVVGIVDNQMVSIWDFETRDTVYQPVIDALSSYVKSFPIGKMHLETHNQVGTVRNFEMGTDGNLIEWNHFYVTLPSSFFASRDDVEYLQAEARDNHQVFKRTMDEFTLKAIDTVQELIASNSLYRGEEWATSLARFRGFKVVYDSLPIEQRDNWCWVAAARYSSASLRIRNQSIGVLLTDISNGVDLDTAVRKYEAIVAPANYKRTKAIFTKKMVEDAQKTITELGYLDALPRRHARLDDITVNNILFANRDAVKRMKVAPDVFGTLASEATTKPIDFSRVEEIGVQDFVEKVLPAAREVEAYVENRHMPNLVSLIAPQNPDAPSLFKWNNGFGWAYNGNIADSDIRKNVKNAGGKVDGVLRFSIQWNDGDKHNTCDYDAHCETPDDHIFYNDKQDRYGGNLDVDILSPKYGVPAVENIVWGDKFRMPCGEYHFYVHCFASRSNDEGFRAELEVDGITYSFDYCCALGQDRKIRVATVTLNKNGTFDVQTHIRTESQSSKKIWGVQTNQFVPVTTVMYSPNYWDEQQGIGHRHYFFMLDGCVNPDSPNGFYNEFVKQELLQHKRVFEALGAQMKVEPTDEQLSGLGFSATKRNELVVRVTGATKRVMKIKF